MVQVVQDYHRMIVRAWEHNKSLKHGKIRRQGRAITLFYQHNCREDGRPAVSRFASKILLPRKGSLIQADHSPEKVWMWKTHKSRQMQRIVQSLRL